MEEVGPSFRCPECNYGLLTAAFLNFGFFGKSHCPYCGTGVRWSLKPLLAILIGSISAGTGLYLLGEKSILPAELTMIPATVFGIGFCIILLGLLTIRFETPKTRKKQKPHQAPIRAV